MRAHQRARIEALVERYKGRAPAPIPKDPTTMAARLGFDLDPWQRELLESRDQQCIVLASRQVGKSTAVALLSLHEVLTNRGRLVLMVSASLRQAGELFRRAHLLWRELGRPVGAVSETTMSLELENGSRLLSLPPSPTTIRGYAADVLVIDEAACVPDETYNSVRPVLAAIGGRLIALSTPWASSGWYYHAWTEGKDWRRFRATAKDCPRISDEFLEAERRELGPFYFASEYELTFHANVSSVFDMEAVERSYDDTLRATNYLDVLKGG